MSTTTPATSRAELLAAVEASWAPFRDAVDALPIGRFEQRTSAGWTLKELVAHVAAWEETVPPRLAAVRARGDDLGDYEDIDGFNARVVAAVADTPPIAVVERLDRGHAALLAAVADLPASGPLDPLAADIVRWNTTGHCPDHYAELGARVP